MTGYHEDQWDDDLHAPGNWPRSTGGSLRAPGVSRYDLADTPDDPPERFERSERALTPGQLKATLERVRAGRCTLRAADCGWTNDCTRHHPQAEQAAG